MFKTTRAGGTDWWWRHPASPPRGHGVIGLEKLQKSITSSLTQPFSPVPSLLSSCVNHNHYRQVFMRKWHHTALFNYSNTKVFRTWMGGGGREGALHTRRERGRVVKVQGQHFMVSFSVCEEIFVFFKTNIPGVKLRPQWPLSQSASHHTESLLTLHCCCCLQCNLQCRPGKMQINLQLS